MAEKLDDVVADELIRERVRQEIAEIKAAKIALLAHPLTTVFVGFLLTGVVGWFLSTRYEAHQRNIAAQRSQIERQLADRRAQYDSSIQAAQEFAKIVYRRHTRSAMLHSALRRNAPLAEVRRRKREYDDAMVEWGSMVQANLFMIRKITSASRYSELKGNLERDLTPAFADVDSCLTEAFDAREKEMAIDTIFKDCGIGTRMQRQFRASYVVTAKLFDAIPATSIEP